MNLPKYILPVTLLSFASLIVSSCDNENPDPVNKHDKLTFPLEKSSRTVLVYAVASNDLYGDWLDDSNEIILGAQRVKGIGEDVQIAVYSVIPGADNASLCVIARKDGIWTTVEAKTYDRELFSTDPERIANVIADVQNLAPADNYGLVMWSHATGWTPTFSTHQTSRNKEVQRAFGMDRYGKDSDSCDIIELAEAIPEGVFDYIWFDCCYMGSAEVAYELAPKTPRMVAYPSEVWAEGIPYDLVLPYIATGTPDLIGGARKVSEYFNSKDRCFTIGVYDLSGSGLRDLGELFGKSIGEAESAPALGRIQRYSRSSYGPFYDLRHVCQALAEENTGGAEIVTSLEKALSETVLYRACSDKDFNGHPWDQDVYCGMSVRYPGTSSAEFEVYYNRTRWGSLVNKSVNK